VRFRLELFVEDVAASTRFYADALAFRIERDEGDYAHLRRGDAELGLASVARLPEEDPAGGFTRGRVAAARGAGVEIVLEVEDLLAAAGTVERAGYTLVEPPRDRPWGQRDFRLTDPDGYYVRVTTADEPPAGPGPASRRRC
jgi:lactoylglutathione lyase